MPLEDTTVTVTFLPSGITKTTNHGRQLLAVIREAQLPIGFSCRGQGVCTACAVRVQGNANSVSPQESELLERIQDSSSGRHGALRIACLVRTTDDLTVQTDYW